MKITLTAYKTKADYKKNIPSTHSKTYRGSRFTRDLSIAFKFADELIESKEAAVVVISIAKNGFVKVLGDIRSTKEGLNEELNSVLQQFKDELEERQEVIEELEDLKKELGMKTPTVKQVRRFYELTYYPASIPVEIERRLGL